MDVMIMLSLRSGDGCQDHAITEVGRWINYQPDLARAERWHRIYNSITSHFTSRKQKVIGINSNSAGLTQQRYSVSLYYFYCHHFCVEKLSSYLCY